MTNIIKIIKNSFTVRSAKKFFGNLAGFEILFDRMYSQNAYVKMLAGLGARIRHLFKVSAVNTIVSAFLEASRGIFADSRVLKRSRSMFFDIRSKTLACVAGSDLIRTMTGAQKTFCEIPAPIVCAILIIAILTAVLLNIIIGVKLSVFEFLLYLQCMIIFIFFFYSAKIAEAAYENSFIVKRVAMLWKWNTKR